MAPGGAKLGRIARTHAALRPALLTALALALICLTPAGAAGAPYEPNDAVTGAAGPLFSGQSYSAAIETDGDRDFYSFYVTAPDATRVELTVQNLGGGGKMSDVDATIFDATSTPIAAQAFIRDGESRVIAAELEPQKYYVEIAANEGFGDSYSLAAGGGKGAFGSYAQISGRCTQATAAARRASRQLSRARSRLQRTKARLRRSRYAAPTARRRARAAHRKTRRLVSAKRRALRAANRSTRPWCAIAQ